MELRGKKQQLEECTHVLDEYKKLFTTGIRKIIETGTRLHLEDEDITFCCALESMVPKAYKYMRTEVFLEVLKRAPIIFNNCYFSNPFTLILILTTRRCFLKQE